MKKSVGYVSGDRRVDWGEVLVENEVFRVTA
jgi:hypothetical protein